MYFPYFRGKQYELIAIRESAKILNESGFIPIIEPVRETLRGLKKTLDEISETGGEAIVIVNPDYGDHRGNGSAIVHLLTEEYSNHPNLSLGVLLNEDITEEEINFVLENHVSRVSSFIHAGYTEAKSLAQSLSTREKDFKHIFVEKRSGKLYQRHFNGSERILLRDGFKKRINRDHPEIEFFSDLHATLKDEGMDGFGDFLIVGDKYSESGGPAYAVAIHLTYIDRNKDDEMHIHHFKSIRQDDPKDPAGKFSEALEKLVNEANRTDTQLLQSSAIAEFLEFHKRGHFPGLGYVKKLSMKHHIETLAHYIASR